ncbi:protein kinase domain-containing protein [Nonomuraea sp. H19]|uniref:serine/threonine-protein kinase n=1 Tax=Nonomuraea sp. H19 TaxID=3452206 RepID=UPI003F8C89FB
MLPVEDAPGYRVLDQAGQGGFAVVYRAYQERLDRLVALKVLSVDRVDQRTMRRFQRELQLTGRLTGHPNVVTVFDTGVTRSGKPYIAMDFFENGSLRDKIRREGPLPVPDVLRAGVKLAGALAAVHEAGVLHGDIKPQNILISRYGELAIADFGVARVVDAAEISATSQAFTPLHAAPEVLTGAPHSASTDIYSLGSTLYHLLAGQPAFHNPSDPSIAPLMYRVLSLEPPRINRSDVPPAVFQLILRAMSKQPELRYGSARELARHLQAVQAELGLPVTDLVGQDPGPQAAGQGGTHGTGAGGLPPTDRHGDYATGRPEAQGPGPDGVHAARSAQTVPPGQPDSPDRAGRLPRGLVIGGAVAAVAIGGSAAAVYLSLQQTTAPQAAPTSQQTSRPQATAPIGKQDIAALKPRSVKVTADQGALVELRWALPAGARRYPVVLQRSPVKKGEQAITALGQGATSARVAGLDPDTGYCFLVGVPLRISEDSTVAWSKPTCIRGAVARRTP